MNHVEPIEPLAPFVGGKFRLAKTIIERINGIPHTTYAEPFMGMGGVFFRRTNRPTAEIINDLNKEMINVFRVIQYHNDALMDYMKYFIHCQGEYDRHRKTDPATLTDIQRAARFIYLQRLSYGGKINGGFPIDVGKASAFNARKVSEALQKTHTRLQGVTLTNMGWSEFIRRYDAPETLFYCDPPYFGSESIYDKNMFCSDDFALMAEQLASIKGKFVLSINDVPYIQQLFSGFEIEKVAVRYSFSRFGRDKKNAELIVSNTPPLARLI